MRGGKKVGFREGFFLRKEGEAACKMSELIRILYNLFLSKHKTTF